MTIYSCMRCNYTTHLKSDMKKHLERKKICKHITFNVSPESKIIKIQDKSCYVIGDTGNVDTDIICLFCNKVYKNKYIKNKHQKKCLEHTNQTIISKLSKNKKSSKENTLPLENTDYSMLKDIDFINILKHKENCLYYFLEYVHFTPFYISNADFYIVKII